MCKRCALIYLIINWWWEQVLPLWSKGRLEFTVPMCRWVVLYAGWYHESVSAVCTCLCLLTRKTCQTRYEIPYQQVHSWRDARDFNFLSLHACCNTKGDALQADGRAAAKLVPMSIHGEIIFTRPEFSRETAESGGSSELKGSVLPQKEEKSLLGPPCRNYWQQHCMKTIVLKWCHLLNLPACWTCTNTCLSHCHHITDDYLSKISLF